MSTAVARPWTIEDFLAWERAQDDRWELLDGLVLAMVGGTADHNTITLNVASALRAATRGGPCRVFAESMKLVTAVGVMYPDVVVTCTEVAPKADHVDDPVLIVEVLSRSTQEIDRGRKWLAYQQLASLRQYVLVSQDEARVDVFLRQARGWSYDVLSGLDAQIVIAHDGSRLPLAAVYESTSVAS
jgi:Uma2 family endonuclease